MVDSRHARFRRAGLVALLVLALALALSAAAPAAPLELRDDRGVLVKLAAPATRIVSLAPFLTELAFAAGAGPRLVAVTAWSDFPSEARALPQVGDAFAIDLERLLMLKADLVLAWTSGNHPGDLARIAAMGIPVLALDARRIADVPRLLRLIGVAAQVPDAANRAADFEQRLDELRRRHGDARPVPVFIEVWHAPLMTVSGRHFASDAVAVCGGRNIFGEARALTPTVGLEDVLAADPEAIVGGGSNADQAAMRDNWRALVSLRAVRAGNLFAVDPDLLQRPGPRILDGIARICAAFAKVRGETAR